MQLRPALVLWIALAAGACRGPAASGAPCGAVALRFVTVAKDALGSAHVDDATTHAVSEQLPALRDSLAQACTDGKWSAAVRDCLAQAVDHVAFEACEQSLTSDQRRALDLASRGQAAE